MKPVVFLRTARRDLGAESGYLLTVDPALALRFLDAVEATSAAISEFPEAMQVLEGEIRRWPLRTFPHGLLYRVEEHRVVVLSVFHPKRNPAHWRARF